MKQNDRATYLAQAIQLECGLTDRQCSSIERMLRREIKEMFDGIRQVLKGF